MYRMSHASFVKLLQVLDPWLLVDHRRSTNASKGKQPIIAELIMHCTLCYLAGGSIHDIRVTAGMSATSFYRCVFWGIDAISCCSELKIKFPALEELHKSAHEFHQCSGEGVLNGCVAALDGWLCCIRIPSAQETNQVVSYFSGHYQCHGLNVQATCDANC